MFTGIVSAVGRLAAVDIRIDDARSIWIEAPAYSDAALGESVAVNGVCLTVAVKRDKELRFDLSPETCARSNLGRLERGSPVNLERALRAADRLSGHIVQGHVDGRAKLAAIRDAGDGCRELEVDLAPVLSRYVVEKGSIALDGISLTVNSIENSMLYLMIVPHTWVSTALYSKQIGQDFNVEVDVVAKYVEKLVSHRGSS